MKKSSTTFGTANSMRYCNVRGVESLYWVALRKAPNIANGYKLHYPLGTPDDTVADEIPRHIASDFSEALRCRWVNAYNATAEMCRRALEASCIELGAPARAKLLINKIDWLEEQRKITPFLKDVAHKIRLGGNRGAHPSEDEPPITDEQADAIIKFAREFFHHIYVVPSELDKYDFSKPAPPPRDKS
jgi:hypothetical protein